MTRHPLAEVVDDEAALLERLTLEQIPAADRHLSPLLRSARHTYRYREDR